MTCHDEFMDLFKKKGACGGGQNRQAFANGRESCLHLILLS